MYDIFIMILALVGLYTIGYIVGRQQPRTYEYSWVCPWAGCKFEASTSHEDLLEKVVGTHYDIMHRNQKEY